MHKIVISGYYGFNNIGDESILTSIIDHLKSSMNEKEITVLSANPQSTTQKHHVHAINRKNIWEIYKEIKNCKLLISGGGSLLQDVTSGRNIIYYLAIMFIGILLRKKIMIYSQGIGPINRGFNKLMTKWILNKVDCITVRDEKSKEELLNMGVEHPPIYVTADPVISLRKGNVTRGRGILANEGIDPNERKPLIGFAIRGWKKDDRLIQLIAKTADQLIENLKVDVVFIPFHYGEDVKIMEEIEDMMDHKGIILKNRYDIQEMLGIVGNLDLMVGVRLHSLIFASVMNVPMIALSYDPKINSFMELLGFHALCSIEDLTYEDLLVEIENKWNHLENDRETLNKRVLELQRKLQINGEQVEELLL